MCTSGAVNTAMFCVFRQDSIPVVVVFVVHSTEEDHVCPDH